LMIEARWLNYNRSGLASHTTWALRTSKGAK
jgi:hypothetical protein